MTKTMVSGTQAVDAGLFWNPGAISYLAQMLLALVLTAYLAKRLYDERRQGRDVTPTLLFCLTVGWLVPGLLVSLLHAMAGGGWASYLMPWLSPRSPWVLAMPWVTAFTGVSAVTFVQFAYRFPDRLPGAGRESRIVGVAMAGCVLVEVAAALRTDLAMLADQVWFRPEAFAIWTNVGMIWGGVVFLRQLLHAQASHAPDTASDAMARFRRGLASIFARPENREATAARGFLAFMLLPIVHTTALVLQQGGLLGPYPIDILICWSVLAQLVGFALVYLGYLPERSSFQFKLTLISLALLLATMNGACWIVGPGYTEQFHAVGMVRSDQTIRFSPDGAGGYESRAVPIAAQSSHGAAVGTDGARVVLPFDFLFYERAYRVAYVGGDGVIGFDQAPGPLDMVFGYGVHPAVYTLLVDPPEGGATVTAWADTDRLVVTRRDRCVPSSPDRCYSFQTVLHADGRIDFIYLGVPVQPRFRLFEPMAGPWLVGITPGRLTAAKDPALRPLIRDYHHDFLSHLDRLYAPIVGFLIGAVIAVMIGMPLLFRSFLIRPLDRLLRGMRRFRDGDLDTQVAVAFNDEIGYLTESFNAMARSQHDLVTGLEATVAERVAEVTDVTARNAQLEERNRLSADLHDSVSQTLFSASLLADVLPDQWRRDPEAGAVALRRIADLQRHALHETRLLFTELRADDHGERPLGETLAGLARSFAVSSGLEVRQGIVDEGDLPLPAQIMFTRVVQECFANIARHAQARNVELHFEATAGRATLRIRDDGRGFDPAERRPGHFGQEIMRQRAQRVGAKLDVESRPGQGAEVTVVWTA